MPHVSTLIPVLFQSTNSLACSEVGLSYVLFLRAFGSPLIAALPQQNPSQALLGHSGYRILGTRNKGLGMSLRT